LPMHPASSATALGGVDTHHATASTAPAQPWEGGLLYCMYRPADGGSKWATRRAHLQ
jgi:hypothetical protein